MRDINAFDETGRAFGQGLADAPPIEVFREDKDGKPIKPPPDEDPKPRVRPVVRK